MFSKRQILDAKLEASKASEINYSFLENSLTETDTVQVENAPVTIESSFVAVAETSESFQADANASVSSNTDISFQEVSFFSRYNGRYIYL